MTTAALSSTSIHHTAGHRTIRNAGHKEDRLNYGLSNKQANWDEEVVPALKRQLEADRAQLDTRMQDFDVKDEATRQQLSTRPRPTPKRMMRNDEIIQDGLGNDELIPSEWATGSKARFVTASSSHARRRTHEHDDEYQRPQHTRRPVTGSSVEGTSPSLTILQAREKARQVARERGEPDALLPLPNGGDSGALATSHRARTVSSPGQRVAPSQRTVNLDDDDATPDLGKASPRDGTTTPSSRIPLPASGSMSKFSANFSPTGTPSLRPTKSASVLTPKDASPEQSNDVTGRTTASIEQGVTPKGIRPPPAVRNVTPIKNKQSPAAARSTGKGKSYGALQRSPSTTQDVLDEFGPLGGSPRQPRGGATGAGDGGSGVSEFGVADGSRSASNPWDEELIPTVKRRLAQQAMAEQDPRFSHVDGLIDTWDRFGNPLSTRTVSAQRRDAAGEESASYEGAAQAAIRGDDDIATDAQGADGPQETSHKENSLRPDRADEQQDRLRRLTQQLDMGLHAEEDVGKQQTKMRVASRQEKQQLLLHNEQMQEKQSVSLRSRTSRREHAKLEGEAYEMYNAQHAKQTAPLRVPQQSQGAHAPSERRSGTDIPTFADERRPNAAMAKDDEQVSAGCKCIIM